MVQLSMLESMFSTRMCTCFHGPPQRFGRAARRRDQKSHNLMLSWLCIDVVFHGVDWVGTRPLAGRKFGALVHYINQSLQDENFRGFVANGRPNVWTGRHSTYLSPGIRPANAPPSQISPNGFRLQSTDYHMKSIRRQPTSTHSRTSAEDYDWSVLEQVDSKTAIWLELSQRSQHRPWQSAPALQDPTQSRDTNGQRGIPPQQHQHTTQSFRCARGSTMAKCAASNCAFLDQYQNYLLQIDKPPWTTPLAFPQPPPIVADPDIAGLGVFPHHSSLVMAYIYN